MTYNPQIKTYYSDQMSSLKKVGESRSPEKPKLLMEYLVAKKLTPEFFTIEANFPPFSKQDFYIAHSTRYVDCFFEGKKPLAESNGLKWSPEFAQSVTYTNASLYHAIREAVLNPSQVTFSPISGMHHAQPESGLWYCTFSGQVIASIKVYQEFGIAGAYIDLDGHFGNSIEDSREFNETLNLAVPRGMNVNPIGIGSTYIESFKKGLESVKAAALAGTIGYIVWCHGADSEINDDLFARQCSTQEWVECAQIFYQWVNEVNALLINNGQKQLGIILTLFGGYRQDDFNSVLSLHTADLVQCLNLLCGHQVDYQLEVVQKE